MAAETNLLIVQLTDIHFKDEDTLDASFLEKIKRKLRPYATGKRTAVLALTGDIAFSGQSDQYVCATDLVSAVTSELEAQGVSTVHIVSTPGNHDCVLSPNKVRDLVITEARNNPGKPVDSDLINACVQVQNDYESFAKLIETPSPHFNDRLWKEFTFVVDGRKFGVFCINAAWCSQLHEVQGAATFPIESYAPRLVEMNADVNIVLIHHPQNWFQQGEYQKLRAFFRSTHGILLSGHEHQGLGTFHATDEGDYFHFEGLALNPEVGVDRGINVIDLDFENNVLNAHRINFDTPPASTDTVWRLPSHIQIAKKASNLTPSFREILDDPGGVFTTADGEAISRGDLYVYPDVEGTDEQNEKVYLTADQLLSRSETSGNLLFYGSDTAGKTGLAYAAFDRFHSQGLTPVFLDAKGIKHSSQTELQKDYEKAIGQQYLEPNDVLEETRSNVVVIIDDLDNCASRKGVFTALVEFAKAKAGRVIGTADSSFDTAELVDTSLQMAIQEFQSYRIRPFGHQRRHELIKRWVDCKPPVDITEYQCRMKRLEDTIDAVIGKNFVPRQPVYILVLLQGMEAGEPSQLQQSSYAYYYHYLIQKGLNDAGVSPGSQDEIMNYLSQLAWFSHSNGGRALTLREIEGFNHQFCERFHNVDLSSRLRTLIKARLLRKHEERYGFYYSYASNFFLGRYLSRHMDGEEESREIARMSGDLRNQHSANALLFLLYHDSSRQVIETIRENLHSCFSSFAAARFEDDMAVLNDLVGSSTRLALRQPNVDESGRAYRETLDKADIAREAEEADETSTKNETSEALEILHQVALMSRTSEILGQILKTYYGSLERDRKQELLDEIFDAPLRLFSGFLSAIGDDPKALIAEIEKGLEHSGGDGDAEWRKRRATKIAYQILGTFAVGVVARPARDVATDELAEDIKKLTEAKNTIAHRLMRAAAIFARPRLLELDFIGELASQIKDHGPFAFKILQSLGVMHMHMFHIKQTHRQALCKILDIDLMQTHTGDLMLSSMKNLPKK